MSGRNHHTAAASAEAVLRRLLSRAEKAQHAASPRRLRLALNGRQCPEYQAQRDLDAKEAFLAVFNSAAAQGAIDVHLAKPRGFEEAEPAAIEVRNITALAAFLGQTLRHDRVLAAASVLQRAQAHFPVVTEVINQWQAGKKVRRQDECAAPHLAAAARLLMARQQELEEALLRRESIRLFGDGKYIETHLAPWLDLLLHQSLEASGLEKRDIFARIGLRHAPQPLLLAGHGHARLQDGPVRLCRDYLGLPMNALLGLEAAPAWLLSIENAQTFFEAAQALARRQDGLIIYTAGMPSPAWASAYRRIVRDLPASTCLYHWGDIDLGGFRIARRIAEIAKAQGRKLLPWQMQPQADAPAFASARIARDELLHVICDCARQAGWEAIADALVQTPLLLEQEALPLALP